MPPPDANLLAQFPEYPDLAGDPARQRLNGWARVDNDPRDGMGRESLPYTDLRNSEIAMDAAADRFRYVLERPIAEAAGSRWTIMGARRRCWHG